MLDDDVNCFDHGSGSQLFSSHAENDPQKCNENGYEYKRHLRCDNRAFYQAVHNAVK